MYCTKKVNEDVTWVGGSDRRLNLFENAFPVPRGISYNSYLIMDEKTVLMDTVDRSVSSLFLENLEETLHGKKLDYLIVNHMEPDHCAVMSELLFRYPGLHIVGNAKTMMMIRQFFDLDIASAFEEIKEGSVLKTGKHEFTFYMAPMVHWPEVMVTYDNTDKILYSADAFGTFGAMDGNLFADELRFKEEWLAGARSYYANIVGKYGVSVQALLKKADSLDVKMIAPLHGPVWRKDLSWYIDKYQKWSSYQPEEESVLVVYGSIYGHTENAASILSGKLADMGIRNIVMYDVSVTHPADLVSEAFRCSHIIVASATYNGGIFTPVENLLMDLKAHNLQNRVVGIIENGSWGPVAGRKIKEIFETMKDISILEPVITVKSSVKEEQLELIGQLAAAVKNSMKS